MTNRRAVRTSREDAVLTNAEGAPRDEEGRTRLPGHASESGALEGQIVKNRLTVELPIPPMALSKNGRTSWQQRHRLFQEHKRVAKNRIDEQMDFCEWRWTGRVRVAVEWAGRGRMPDSDNIIARLSAAIDAGQAAGLYVNDDQIASWQIEHIPGPPRVVLTFHHEEE